MALKGSLRDFGLSEILQLIGHQNKSGVLTVTDKGSEVKIFFHEGDIVSTSASPMPAELEWRELLVRSRLISPPEFDLAEKKSKESLQPLELTLLKFKALSEDELKQMIRLRSLEIINNLFLLNEGDYEFESGSVSYLEQLAVPINSEQVLMDGYRVKDEWPQIKKAVPSMDMYFMKTGGEFPPEAKLEQDEDRIYRMVGRDYTAQDIIFLSRMGKFETCKILASLLEKGRIQPVSADRATSAPRATDSNRLIRTLFYPVFIILFLLLLNGIRINLLKSAPFHAQRGLEELYQTGRIEQALESYRLVFGAYPEGLDSLSETGFISRDELTFPWGKKYMYEYSGDSYILKGPVSGGGRN